MLNHANKRLITAVNTTFYRSPVDTPQTFLFKTTGTAMM